MIDDWFRAVELRITIDEFHRLPRAAGYKHEYFDDRAVLSPRPRNGYAALHLDRFESLAADRHTLDSLTVRPIAAADWDELGPLCGAAFHRVPPFSTLTDDEQVAAGRDCMAYVRSGGDGPLVPAASMVAAGVGEDAWPCRGVCGALLVVLKPAGYRDDPWRNRRSRNGAAGEPPPPPTQAHIDWVFVSPWLSNHGVASALLARTVEALRAAGHASLTSSFLIGNGESMAWHWRNGFELLPNPGSMRRPRQPSA